MLYPLARYWWTIAVRGVIAVFFGILTFLFPGISLLSLVLLFGAYVLLDGVFAVAAAIGSPSHHWALIVEGIFGIVAGILTVVWPGITGFVLLYMIAWWAILTGILEIVSGFRVRQTVSNEVLLIIMGILSVVFGVCILLFPAAVALAIAYWIGVYAVVFGIVMIALALRLRHFVRSAPEALRAVL